MNLESCLSIETFNAINSLDIDLLEKLNEEQLK